MEKITRYFSELFANMGRQLSLIGWTDVLDIVLLTFVLFFVYRFIRNRRAGKLALGVLVVLVLLVLCEIIELNAMRYLLKNVVQVGIIALMILFQPELRSALETMGNQPIRSIKSFSESKDLARFNESINAICEAATELSRSRTGAIIVFERDTKLGDITRNGVAVDANINPYLIRNIFHNGAPLHDGAVVVSNFRICAAGCYLPLSQNPDISKDLGTRHRAAIGMSEVSDAVVLCVSEETGIISLVIGGQITRRYNYQSLNKKLTEVLITKDVLKRMRKKGNSAEKQSEEENG